MVTMPSLRWPVACERNEVQEDFELICFDLVSSPSTPGAYLFLNKDDKGKYEENLEEEKRPEPEARIDGGMGAAAPIMTASILFIRRMVSLHRSPQTASCASRRVSMLSIRLCADATVRLSINPHPESLAHPLQPDA